MDAPFVTSAYEELNICFHEGYGHVDVNSVGEDEIRPMAEDLDESKDVVPSATIKAANMIPKLEDYLQKC